MNILKVIISRNCQVYLLYCKLLFSTWQNFEMASLVWKVPISSIQPNWFPLKHKWDGINSSAFLQRILSKWNFFFCFFAFHSYHLADRFRHYHFCNIEPSFIKKCVIPILNYNKYIFFCFTIFSKQFQIEIEQLTARLVEAETKLKTEIQRLKKKYQIQITELEMSLDVANKNNIELQKTIKRQALQITVRWLFINLRSWCSKFQYFVLSYVIGPSKSLRRIAASIANNFGPIWNCPASYPVPAGWAGGNTGQHRSCKHDFRYVIIWQRYIFCLSIYNLYLLKALRAKRAAEQQYEEAHARVNELTTINVNISAAKSKLEGEFAAIQADYDEVTKELKVN